MADDFSIIAASMQKDLHSVNLSSDNVANVNTPGFKRSVSFSDYLSTGQPSTVVDSRNASLKQTQRNLDVGLTGDAYFVLSSPSGNKVITRDGRFNVDSQGYLSIGDLRVQGESGDIFIGDRSVLVDQLGNILIGELQDSFKLVSLDNKHNLVKVSANTFQFSSSLTDSEKGTYSVHQGFLENSNVDAKDEMINMTTSLRHFELQQKVLRNYNSMIEVGISNLGDF